MNKFVKGAKNLAFALSFVTVAACGVKKGDLEALEKSIKEEVGKKADKGDCVVKSELEKINGEVEKKIGVEVQKVKTEVLTQIADGKKDVLLGILKPDFSNLEEVVRTKGCEDLLKGFVFGGKFVDGSSNNIKIEGGVEKDGFVVKFGSGDKKACDDVFFKNFVKCGGVVEIEGLDKMRFEQVKSAKTIKICGVDAISIAELAKVLGFLKMCGLLKKAGDLNIESCFKNSKKFSVIAEDLDNADCVKIINAVCDEGSFDEGKLPAAGGGAIAVTFKINGVDCSWKIAES